MSESKVKTTKREAKQMRRDAEERTNREFSESSRVHVDKFTAEYEKFFNACSEMVDLGFRVHVHIDNDNCGRVTVRRQSPTRKWITFIG